jgi:flagellar biosynthetic protein FliQ
MSPEGAVELVRRTLLTTFWLSAPLLLVGFAAGIAVSLLQIATSIQDSAFNTVPRLAAFWLAMAICLPWMLAKLMSFTAGILGNLAAYAH